jgi:hypothetical protein
MSELDQPHPKAPHMGQIVDDLTTMHRTPLLPGHVEAMRAIGSIKHYKQGEYLARVGFGRGVGSDFGDLAIFGRVNREGQSSSLYTLAHYLSRGIMRRRRKSDIAKRVTCGRGSEMIGSFR